MVGEFTELPAGSYAVSLRAADAEPGTPPALSGRIDVPAGGARTVAISGAFADLALQAFDDDLSAPPAGSARVRVLAGAATAGALEVVAVPGPTLATGLAFGGAGDPVVVPAGPATLRISGGSVAPVDLPVEFAARSVVTVLVLDDPAGGLTARVLVDAAGPARVPVGAVEAGSGPPAGPPLAGASPGSPYWGRSPVAAVGRASSR